MENTGRPKSKSSVRKGKKDWKKNIDITDVENDLEEIRKEEIAFGGKIEDQANEELFTIDVEGDSEVKRKNKSKKLLTIEEILKPQSKVKAFGSNRNKDSKNVSRFNLSKYTKEQVEKINKRKAEGKLKKVNKKKKTGSIITKDLWEESDNTEQQEQEYNFFNQPKPKAPSTLKYNKIAEKVEAVKVGHPGTSYNPTFDDHQDALRIAVDIEQKKEDEKAKIEKQLSYPPELDEISDHEVIYYDNEEEEEEDDTIEDQKIIKTTEKKTKAQRNKEKKLKEKEEKRLEKLRQKEMSKQIEEIEKIQKVIDEEEKNTIEKMNKPKKEKMPRLGKVRYQAKSMDIQLTEELSESLRGLKPEGNLFTDRFKSLQERAIIEPRVRNTKERRYKLKEYEKHSYKKFK